jgi:hypothetical protein
MPADFSCLFQVYGGAISVIVGSYVRSQIGLAVSKASCDDTRCNNCDVSMVDVSIACSDAVSSITG